VRLDPNGAESADMLSLEQIDQALSQGRRVVLEGAAGRGKTTTLIQLAQRVRTAGTAFIVELPAWTSSRRGILEYIAGMPVQVEGLTAADLARAADGTFPILAERLNEIAERIRQRTTHLGFERTPSANHHRNPDDH
jgi:ABC-type multidrug transport system ATPase subunit